MASAHGAGLMLVPVVDAALPCGLAGSGRHRLARPGGSRRVGVHTAAMLATIGAIALVVYRLVGVAFLRRGWINLDLGVDYGVAAVRGRAARRVRLASRISGRPWYPVLAATRRLPRIVSYKASASASRPPAQAIRARISVA